MIKKLLETTSKLLICLVFADDPDFLWITLLKTLSCGPRSLVNQAFRQIAHRLGKKIKPNEINNLSDVRRVPSGVRMVTQQTEGQKLFCA